MTGRPVAENRGSGVGMMIDRVREDTGIVPLFAANLDQFRVTIPRSSPVTPGFLDWAGQRWPGRLSSTQLVVVAMARAGYDIVLALLRRVAPELADPKAELGELIDLGVLRSRKARDDGPFRLAAELRDDAEPAKGQALPLGDLASRLLARMAQVPDVSREELQQATGASRSRLTSILQDLIDQGHVEATAPVRSPNRRYRLTRRTQS